MRRILIVDDHPIVREGLKTYLGLQSDLDVVGEAGDAGEVLAKTEALKPDLVLLDLQLPGEGGLGLIARLRDYGVKVLVLTSFLEEDYVREALHAGASGYLVKHAGPGALLDGIRAALRGERPIDPGALELLANPSENPLEALTGRELEVLSLIAKGMSNKAIAAELGIVEKTVKTHVSNLLAKLDLKDRVQAALYAKERGL